MGGHLMRSRARLRLRQRARTGLWHMIRPPRPPLESPERVAALSRVGDDESFITGNGIAAHCRYVLNFDELTVNETGREDWWFCKSDFLEYFFAKLAPDRPYVLFSHNSDRSVDARFARRAGSPQLRAWFATNLALDQPKLHALPLGIANPKWAHGDVAALRSVRDSSPAKTRLFDASFSLRTNPRERRACLEHAGVELDPPLPFADYLARLASSYFCLSPRGGGIDCHRTWEALYVGTIPVVTRSLLTDQHPELPCVVLDSWADIGSVDFSPELFESLWAAWDPESLRLDRYLERIAATLG